MRNLAAIFLFGVALVALCGSFSGAHHTSAQVQFAPQIVRVANSVADGSYIPVANDRNHPLYAVGVTDAPATYLYKVVPFSPPTVTGAEGSPPTIDTAKLASTLEVLLNGQGDWEPMNIPSRFSPGVNLVVFRHRKERGAGST